MVVGGLGWVKKQEYGCLKHFKVDSGPDRKRLFSKSFEGFGRLDGVSKMTSYAIALALKDAGLDYPLEKKTLTGLIAANRSGCLDSDIRHFRDYLDNGRTLARANLFIYTLPSSPLSEAAIHFGFQGPLFHLTEPDRSLSETLEAAREMIRLDEADVMLAGTAEKDEAAFLLLARKSEYSGEVLCDFTTAESLVEKSQGLYGMIKEFSNKGAG